MGGQYANHRGVVDTGSRVVCLGSGSGCSRSLEDGVSGHCGSRDRNREADAQVSVEFAEGALVPAADEMGAAGVDGSAGTMATMIEIVQRYGFGYGISPDEVRELVGSGYLAVRQIDCRMLDAKYEAALRLSRTLSGLAWLYAASAGMTVASPPGRRGARLRSARHRHCRNRCRLDCSGHPGAALAGQMHEGRGLNGSVQQHARSERQRIPQSFGIRGNTGVVRQRLPHAVDDPGRDARPVASAADESRPCVLGSRAGHAGPRLARPVSAEPRFACARGLASDCRVAVPDASVSQGPPRERV